MKTQQLSKTRSAFKLAVGALLIGAAGLAHATPITYRVLLSNGTDNLSGSITTDGTLGTLAASNIMGWSFTDILTNASSALFSISGSGAGCNAVGCGLSASAQNLYFNNIVSAGNQVAFDSAQNGGSSFYIRNGFGGNWLYQQATPFLGQFMSFQQTSTLTLATVPEPTGLALVGTALAAAGLASRRQARVPEA